MGVLSFGELLPVVRRGAGDAVSSDPGEPARAAAEDAPRLSCALVVGDLDTGGVETIVSVLARGLPALGFDVEVICTSGGHVERMLRDAGVHVSLVPTAGLGKHLAQRRPDVVQLHRLDPTLMAALSVSTMSIVPVLHAMESYLTPSVWGEVRDLLSRVPASIAVSESVREYFRERTQTTPYVVENGVPPVGPDEVVPRGEARAEIGRALGHLFEGDEIIVLGLQRFSDQKNPAGLVDAFLLAAEQDERLHLVVAGAPNSWLEFRRADVIRRRHRQGGRVHFLGDSDARILFAAADAFALDSFSEGGPIAALEAVAHGLPIVLSEVGFTRQLVAACAPHGVLVPRANDDFSQKSMARQRRRSHQSNREAFARGLLAVTSAAGGPGTVPERFTEERMLLRHAEILRSAAR